MKYPVYLYIAVMAIVTYLIRMLPLTLIKKEIKNPFIRSFLYYVPYVTLSVMTFPAIIYATASPVSGAAALAVALFFAYKGKSLYEVLESYVRKGFYAVDPKEKERGKDMMWYIWLSENSPLFGKDKMATFERYFLADKETHKEKKNPYYCLLENEKVINGILKEFGLPEEGTHIINGHVPVKSKNGENPIKCNGKVLVIDGGFSRAYQKETGIAGYTLIYNSYGLILAAHEPFESTEAAIEKESDIHSESIIVKRVSNRKLVGDTDVGCQLKTKIRDLEMLLEAYHTGKIVEKFPVRQGI